MYAMRMYAKGKICKMISIKVLLLLSAILPSQSEMYSLNYMYSVVSKSGDIYEFYNSVELGDIGIQMCLCNRVKEAYLITQLCEDSERLFNERDDLDYKQQWFQTIKETLMKHRNENSTQDTARPDVHTLVKASGSSGTSLLVCLATGFYPKHVQMEIRLNQTPVPEDQLNSEGKRPNADGSFQLKKSLEILSSERSQYQCVVTHQSDIIEDCWVLLCDSDDVREPSSSLGSMGAVIGVSSCFFVVFFFFLTFSLLRNYGKQDTLKTPSLVQLSALHKTQMNPELLEEIRPEICAAALHTDSDEENPTDPSIEEVHTEEVHDTQSLCETEATPAARGAMMGSRNISLPNFAMEKEDADQNTVTQNALLLPLPRRCRSKDISLPNLV